MPTPFNPNWTPPFYADGSVPGEHTAAKVNQIIAIIQLILEWLGFARGNVFNIEEYGAVGNGSLHSAKFINEAVKAAESKGGVVEVPPGEFWCEEAVKQTAGVTLQGANRRSAALVCGGEFNLIENTAGDSQLERLFLRCHEPQKTKGAAVDFSNGFAISAIVENCFIGSNFYNGVNAVSSESLKREAAYITIKDVICTEYNSQIKSIGKAMFVWGGVGAFQRVFNSTMINVFGVAATQKDVPKWFEIRNTDSLKLTNCQFQNGGFGLRVGEGDTSALGTTNLSCEGVQFDGGAEGMQCYVLERLLYSDFDSCHAQGGAPGVLVGASVSQVNWTGGSVYVCYTCGFFFNGAVSPAATFNITGTQIACNGTLGKTPASESSGVFIEKGGGGVTITGCTIANPYLVRGTATQRYGVYIEKDTVTATRRNITIVANRIPDKGSGKPETGAGAENLTKGIENATTGTEAETGILIASNNPR